MNGDRELQETLKWLAGPVDRSGVWASIEARADGRKQSSTPRRITGPRVAVYASLAVVLVAGLTVGGLEAVKHLGKDQPVLVITDDPTGLSPGSTTESGQMTATDSQSGHWERLPLTTEGGGVSVLAIDPSNPLVLYAARSDGLFKSFDGARSWDQLAPIENEFGPAEANLIVVDPASPHTVYVTAWFGAAGLLRSDNGGITWVDLSSAWLDVSPSIGNTIDLSPEGEFWMWCDTTSSPSTVYVAGPDFRTVADTAVWRSVDRGESWTKLSAEEAAQALAKQPQGGSRSDFQGTVTDADTGAVLPVTMGRIDPHASSIRYAGTEEGVYKSTDGGATWKRANGTLVASAVWRVVPDPISSSILYAATPEGIFKSHDSGITWNMILVGEGLMVVAPSSPSTLYAWTSAGLFRTDDGGARWTRLAGTGLAPRPEGWDPSWGGLDLVAPDDPETLFARSGPKLTQLFRSMDGGNTWSQILEDVTAVAADPNAPSTLFAVTDSDGVGQVLKSTDAGGTWTAVGPADEWASGVESLALSIHAPSAVYVVANQGDKERGPQQVFRSPDGGATWEKVDTTRFESLADPFSSPERLLFDPRSPDTLYVTVSFPMGWSVGGDIYRSTDGGSTWQSIIGDFSGVDAYALQQNVVIDPAPGGGLYSMTNAGLYRWVPAADK